MGGKKSNVPGASTSTVSVTLAVVIFLITYTMVLQCKGANDMPFDADVFAVPPGYNAPQQVHITQGDIEGRAVIVSWITPDEEGSPIVSYWDENSNNNQSCNATVQHYTFINYTSGFIHHCLLDNLDFDTKYFYMVGIGDSARTFFFTTPPRPGDVPYTFGLIGDLGQTHHSNSTLRHYEENPVSGQAVLYMGDLSYVDHYHHHDNVRWDTWGRFIERNAAYQPWIWTAGNHEIDYSPTHGETEPFKPFLNRYPTPYQSSGSNSPLWYSIKRGPAYIIVLSSYSAVGKYTPQYKWLKKELKKVDFNETGWLIVLMHAPFYSSYVDHFMDGETMRVVYEPLFVKYGVDLVFSGHVHAYERNHHVSNIRYNISNGDCTPVRNGKAPAYVTIGDGGNIEGLSTSMHKPRPEYSAYREASYGHGMLNIKNRTHLRLTWHRNDEGVAVERDHIWFVQHWDDDDVTGPHLFVNSINPRFKKNRKWSANE